MAGSSNVLYCFIAVKQWLDWTGVLFGDMWLVIRTVSGNLKYLYIYPFEAEKIKMKQVVDYMSGM